MIANDSNDTSQLTASPIAPLQGGPLPFTPYAKPGNSNSQGTITISTESGPVTVQESQTNAVESGYDALKPLEQKAEEEAQSNETAEKKEAKPPLATFQPPVLAQDNSKKQEEENQSVESKESVVEIPSFQGHKVPEEMMQNVDEIKAQAGKGDPNSAVSAINIFLDRLLKKQSANSK